MIYTLRKNYKVALYYSWFEVTISAYYYIAMVVGFDWALIPALSFTIMLPISVYYYSKEIDVELPNEEQIARERDFKDLEKWLENNPNGRPTEYFQKTRKLHP